MYNMEQYHEINNRTSLYINDAHNVLDEFTNTVDFIYMDPPYDTNRDFSLDSKSTKIGFSDKWDNYEEWLNAFVSKLKNTLVSTGTLVLHISAENSFVIEKILRDHFTDIEKIFWKRCHGKNAVQKKLGAVVDVLFVAYNGRRNFNRVTIPINENSVWAFKNKDAIGNYSMGALKHDRTRKGHEFCINKDGVNYSSEYGWKMDKESVEELILANRIHFVPKSGNMYIKKYKHEHKGKPLSNLWDDIHSITRTTKDPRLYPTQKPQKLIERLLLIFTNENSVVLDPVCGSGTTGFVAHRMGRRTIMIDMNEEVLPIIQKRFIDNF